MKTLKFKFITKCLMLLFLTINFACTVEDDTPEVKTASFKVKAAAMLSDNFPSTEGAGIEVYGTISTILVVDPNIDPDTPLPNDIGDQRILWTRTSSNWELVGSAEYVINSEGSEQTFTLTEEEINNGARILIYAKLWDKDPDGNPDDYLGETFLEFSAATLKNLNEPKFQQLSFTHVEPGLVNLITARVRFILEHLKD